MLAIAVEKQTEWDTHLPYIAMAYRSSPHDVTTFTPNEMMFGREVSVPLDIMVSLPQAEPQTTCDYVTELRKKLKSAYDLVRNRLKAAANRNKKLYDRNVVGTPFSKGDLVWSAIKARKTGQCPKFLPKWRGPHLITTVFNDVLVEVQRSANRFSVVHTDHLKHYKGKKKPRWLVKALKNLK